MKIALRVRRLAFAFSGTLQQDAASTSRRIRRRRDCVPPRIEKLRCPNVPQSVSSWMENGMRDSLAASMLRASVASPLPPSLPCVRKKEIEKIFLPFGYPVGKDRARYRASRLARHNPSDEPEFTRTPGASSSGLNRPATEEQGISHQEWSEWQDGWPEDWPYQRVFPEKRSDWIDMATSSERHDEGG